MNRLLAALPSQNISDFVLYSDRLIDIFGRERMTGKRRKKIELPNGSEKLLENVLKSAISSFFFLLFSFSLLLFWSILYFRLFF